MTSNLAVKLTGGMISIVIISVGQMFMNLELLCSIDHL